MPSLSIYGAVQPKNNLIAPFELIEEHIWRYHEQGFSFDNMVSLLKKHYDNEVYGSRVCLDIPFPLLQLT